MQRSQVAAWTSRSHIYIASNIDAFVFGKNNSFLESFFLLKAQKWTVVNQQRTQQFFLLIPVDNSMYLKRYLEYLT